MVVGRTCTTVGRSRRVPNEGYLLVQMLHAAQGGSAPWPSRRRAFGTIAKRLNQRPARSHNRLRLRLDGGGETDVHPTVGRSRRVPNEGNLLVQMMQAAQGGLALWPSRRRSFGTIAKRLNQRPARFRLRLDGAVVVRRTCTSCPGRADSSHHGVLRPRRASA